MKVDRHNTHRLRSWNEMTPPDMLMQKNPSKFNSHIFSFPVVTIYFQTLFKTAQVPY